MTKVKLEGLLSAAESCSQNPFEASVNSFLAPSSPVTVGLQHNMPVHSCWSECTHHGHHPWPGRQWGACHDQVSQRPHTQCTKSRLVGQTWTDGNDVTQKACSHRSGPDPAPPTCWKPWARNWCENFSPLGLYWISTSSRSALGAICDTNKERAAHVSDDIWELQFWHLSPLITSKTRRGGRVLAGAVRDASAPPFPT